MHHFKQFKHILEIGEALYQQSRHTWNHTKSTTLWYSFIIKPICN